MRQINDDDDDDKVMIGKPAFTYIYMLNMWSPIVLINTLWRVTGSEKITFCWLTIKRPSTKWWPVSTKCWLACTCTCSPTVDCVLITGIGRSLTMGTFDTWLSTWSHLTSTVQWSTWETINSNRSSYPFGVLNWHVSQCHMASLSCYDYRELCFHVRLIKTRKGISGISWFKMSGSKISNKANHTTKKLDMSN